VSKVIIAWTFVNFQNDPEEEELPGFLVVVVITTRRSIVVKIPGHITTATAGRSWRWPDTTGFFVAPLDEITRLRDKKLSALPGLCLRPRLSF
jgi:hypothetical protein